MSIVNKPLESLLESDLQSLIDNQVAEGKTIEYKEQLPGNSDSDKGEFLADISSFSNATGGHLIFGMKEKAGIPVELCGLQINDAGAEILRLENIVRDGVDPRIPGISMKVLPLQKQGAVIIVRIPKSWALPHMVTFKNYSKFYSRNSAGKYQLDVSEIRARFLLSENFNERIRKFRVERLSIAGGGEAPVMLEDTAKAILHIVPLSAFDTQIIFDTTLIAKQRLNLFPINCDSFSDSKFNLDGYLTYDSDQKTNLCHSFVQVFRNGIIEAVNSSLLRGWNGKKCIPSVAFEESLVDGLKKYLECQKSIGIEPPLFVMLSFLGVRGYSITVKYLQPYSYNEIDRDVLILTEVMIQSFEVDLFVAMKPIFDAVWNAAGFQGSLNYDEKGIWDKNRKY